MPFSLQPARPPLRPGRPPENEPTPSFGDLTRSDPHSFSGDPAATVEFVKEQSGDVITIIAKSRYVSQFIRRLPGRSTSCRRSPVASAGPALVSLAGLASATGRRLQQQDYQIFTRWSFGRIMGEPSGISKAFWNSSKFESGPSVRNLPGECGSVASRSFRSSSRWVFRQIWA
jgi:hypothetical protein